MDEHLRRALTDQAKAGRATTYGELARRLGLQPPQTIHRLALALERLMEDDAGAGRPLLAALCTSKTQTGLPGPGFFLKAQALGLFSGDPAGAEARAFHEGEMRRAISHYGADEPAREGDRPEV